MNTNPALLVKKVDFQNKFNEFVNSIHAELIDVLSASGLSGPFLLKSGGTSSKLKKLISSFEEKYRAMPTVSRIYCEVTRNSIFLNISVNSFKFSGGDSMAERLNGIENDATIWICDHDNEKFTLFSQKNPRKTNYDANEIAHARAKMESAIKVVSECQSIIGDFGTSDYVRQ